MLKDFCVPFALIIACSIQLINDEFTEKD